MSAELRTIVSEAVERGIADLRSALQEDVERGIRNAFASGLHAARDPAPAGYEDEFDEQESHVWTRRHLHRYDSHLVDEEAESGGDLFKKVVAKALQRRNSLALMSTGTAHTPTIVRSATEPSAAKCQPQAAPTSLPGVIEGVENSETELTKSHCPERKARVQSESSQTEGETPMARFSSSVRVIHPSLWNDARGYIGAGIERLRSSGSGSAAGGYGVSRYLTAIVENPKFEGFVCLVILINAVSLGALTDHEVRSKSRSSHDTTMAKLESVFCVVFVIELGLRLAAYRCKFFCMSSWHWNWFDTIVIVLQVVDELLSLASPGSQSFMQGNFNVMRMMRLLRLVRVLRLVRILRHIGELRTLVMAILNSVRSLFWTLVLFTVIIFIVSIYLTQMVADYTQAMDPGEENFEKLRTFYGSMGGTMLSMFMSVTGGLDWMDLCAPLMEEVTPAMGIFFSGYVAFSLLAMLNVVTGVFVESVLKSQAADRDLFMINNVRELFQGLEGGIHAVMTWEDFESKLDEPGMMEFFKAIDVSRDDAAGLFRLLDLDGSKEVSAEEFLNGALRLRGPAKALDVALLIQEVKQIGRGLRVQALRRHQKQP